MVELASVVASVDPLVELGVPLDPVAPPALLDEIPLEVVALLDESSW